MPRKRQPNTEEDRKVLRRYALQDYRTRNHKRLNQKAKERVAKSRANVKELPAEVQEAKRLAQLEYARKYRERNREYLKVQARDKRAARYIAAHGYEAFCINYQYRPRKAKGKVQGTYEEVPMGRVPVTCNPDDT